MSYGCYALVSLGSKIGMIKEDQEEYENLKKDIARATEFVKKNKLI